MSLTLQCKLQNRKLLINTCSCCYCKNFHYQISKYACYYTYVYRHTCALIHTFTQTIIPRLFCSLYVTPVVAVDLGILVVACCALSLRTHRLLVLVLLLLFHFSDRHFCPLGGLFSVFNVKCDKRERRKRTERNGQKEGQAHGVFPNCGAMSM